MVGLTNRITAGVFLILSSFMLLSGCVNQSDNKSGNQSANQQSTSIEKPLNSSAEAEYLWREFDVKNYQFTVELQCFCLPETNAARTIKVVNNKIHSIVLTTTHQTDTLKPTEISRTIDDWFSLLSGYREGNAKQANAKESNTAKTSGKFDSKNGFPLRISVDPHPRIADDEYTVVFRDFKKINKTNK